MNFTSASVEKILKLPTLAALLVLVACVAILLYLLKGKKKEEPQKRTKQIPGMPKIPAMTERFPEQKQGGMRTLDALTLSPENERKRNQALQLAKAKNFKAAAQLLEDAQLQREAIDLLEANGLLDDAATMLMKINRPNRAGVIFERNKNFEKAALYYLRAKLVDDAKRCCKQIKEYSLALSTELAVLFAEAGDKSSALRLLAGINDRGKIIKLTRDTFAYKELAVFLDQQAARALILDSLSISDIEHMLQDMPTDHIHPLTRAKMWLNESLKGEWVLAIFNFVADKRDVAHNFAEQIDEAVLEKFIAHCHNLNGEFIIKNRKNIEWAARGLHDAGRWHAAAIAYEKLNLSILAGKCWALCGQEEKAITALQSTSGDDALCEKYVSELALLGRSVKSETPLAKYEKEALARLFFYIDPDTEKNRVDSPFSIAS